MIYVDTSVVLAQLLAEDRQPPAWLWRETVVASRLLQHEVWTRIHARRLADSHGELVRSALERIAFLELTPPVLERAMEPFPEAVRTLNALHLASVVFLVGLDADVKLATYDERQRRVARRLGLVLAEL